MGREIESRQGMGWLLFEMKKDSNPRFSNLDTMEVKHFDVLLCAIKRFSNDCTTWGQSYDRELCTTPAL
jgi:hypothetical protein